MSFKTSGRKNDTSNKDLEDYFADFTPPDADINFKSTKPEDIINSNQPSVFQQSPSLSLNPSTSDPSIKQDSLAPSQGIFPQAISSFSNTSLFQPAKTNTLSEDKLKPSSVISIHTPPKLASKSATSVTHGQITMIKLPSSSSLPKEFQSATATPPNLSELTPVLHSASMPSQMVDVYLPYNQFAAPITIEESYLPLLSDETISNTFANIQIAQEPSEEHSLFRSKKKPKEEKPSENVEQSQSLPFTSDSTQVSANLSPSFIQFDPLMADFDPFAVHSPLNDSDNSLQIDNQYSPNIQHPYSHSSISTSSSSALSHTLTILPQQKTNPTSLHALQPTVLSTDSLKTDSFYNKQAESGYVSFSMHKGKPDYDALSSFKSSEANKFLPFSQSSHPPKAPAQPEKHVSFAPSRFLNSLLPTPNPSLLFLVRDPDSKYEHPEIVREYEYPPESTLPPTNESLTDITLSPDDPTFYTHFVKNSLSQHSPTSLSYTPASGAKNDPSQKNNPIVIPSDDKSISSPQSKTPQDMSSTNYNSKQPPAPSTKSSQNLPLQSESQNLHSLSPDLQQKKTSSQKPPLVPSSPRQLQPFPPATFGYPSYYNNQPFLQPSPTSLNRYRTIETLRASLYSEQDDDDDLSPHIHADILQPSPTMPHQYQNTNNISYISGSRSDPKLSVSSQINFQPSFVPVYHSGPSLSGARVVASPYDGQNSYPYVGYPSSPYMSQVQPYNPHTSTSMSSQSYIAQNSFYSEASAPHHLQSRIPTDQNYYTSAQNSVASKDKQTTTNLQKPSLPKDTTASRVDSFNLTSNISNNAFPLQASSTQEIANNSTKQSSIVQDTHPPNVIIATFSPPNSPTREDPSTSSVQPKNSVNSSRSPHNMNLSVSSNQYNYSKSSMSNSENKSRKSPHNPSSDKLQKNTVPSNSSTKNTDSKSQQQSSNHSPKRKDSLPPTPMNSRSRSQTRSPSSYSSGSSSLSSLSGSSSYNRHRKYHSKKHRHSHSTSHRHHHSHSSSDSYSYRHKHSKHKSKH